jgi:very-short-patch-repair endonuclease
MLNYNANLKGKARQLRNNSTDSEKALWSRLRNKQLLGIQFYRQKPIGEHILWISLRPGQNWSWKG